MHKRIHNFDIPCVRTYNLSNQLYSLERKTFDVLILNIEMVIKKFGVSSVLLNR